MAQTCSIGGSAAEFKVRPVRVTLLASLSLPQPGPKDFRGALIVPIPKHSTQTSHRQQFHSHLLLPGAACALLHPTPLPSCGPQVAIRRCTSRQLPTDQVTFIFIQIPLIQSDSCRSDTSMVIL